MFWGSRYLLRTSWYATPCRPIPTTDTENKSRESHIIEGQLNAASANAIVTLHAGYCHSLFSTELQAFNTSSHTHFTSFIENWIAAVASYVTGRLLYWAIPCIEFSKQALRRSANVAKRHHLQNLLWWGLCERPHPPWPACFCCTSFPARCCFAFRKILIRGRYIDRWRECESFMRRTNRARPVNTA